MQRYNQGFGRFGPMEKCESGKWAEAEEAEKEIAEKVDVAAAYYDLWTKSIKSGIRVSWQRDVAAMAATLGWSTITWALIKYAFTGHIL